MRISKSRIQKLFHILYGKLKLRKSKLGSKVSVCYKLTTLNPQYFQVGSGCYIGPNCRIEAWDRYADARFSPRIVLGANVRINSTCHIGAINSVQIDEDCLLGSHVMIIDHAHGNNSAEEAMMHPSDRGLFSKGGIRIGPRCWICENAVILPNVHIGEGCVIAASAVVTHDIPPYSVVAGNPGKVVKSIQQPITKALI